MKRNFYIDKIKNVEDLNRLTIILNEMQEVSRIKIGKNNIAFVCEEPEDIKAKMCEVDDTLILKEEINSRKRVYKAPDEKKDMIFMFTNLNSIEEAKEIQEVLSKYRMYENVEIDFANKLLKLTTGDKVALKRLRRIVDKIDPNIGVEQWRKPFKSQDLFQEVYIKKFIRIGLLLIALALGLVTRSDPNSLTNIAWLIALLVCSERMLIAARKDIITKQYLSENVVMLLACIIGWAYGAFIEAIIVSFVFQTGEALLVRCISYTMDKIDRLIHVPQLARKETNGQIEMIPLEEFDIGDTMLVLPDETILLGGEVMQGSSLLNTYAINGSEVLQPVSKGMEVESGSINIGLEIRVKVLHSVDRSALSKILNIASLAPTYQSRMDKMVNFVSKCFTRGLVAIAIVTILVLLAIDVVGNYKYLYFGAILLTVSGTFAYKQASSFAVLAGVSKAFSKGIVIKENSGLDALSLCCTIIYDRFDGVEVTEEELELFAKLTKLHKQLIIFNDGPVVLENDQYKIYNDLSIGEKIAVMEQVELAGPVVYIGDTYKDIVLLQKAFVGISRGGLHDKKVTENSDIMLTNPDYQTILDIFKISRKQRRIIIENTLLGIGCNIVLALMALAFVLPWFMASVGYLVVVFIVLFNTLRILK